MPVTQSRFFCFFLKSDGPLAGVPFIDDYISTTEQVSVSVFWKAQEMWFDNVVSKF